jgi:hypothetical protein
VGRAIGESLSSVAGQLSGRLGSEWIADLGIPLDFLEIRPQFGARGLEAAELAGGVRLGDRVFLTLNPRYCPQSPTASALNLGGSVEFALGAGWSLLASADPTRACVSSGTATFGSPLQLGLDLFWERRF